MEVTVSAQEYLSKDIFEEHFLKTFLVLYRFQFVMGSCRVHAKSRFATPPTTAQKCYSVFCILLTLYLTFLITIHYVSKAKDPVIQYLHMSISTIQFLAFFCNTVHVRFMNGNQNVEFYVKLQKIDRLLKIDKWGVLNEWVGMITNYPLVLIQILFYSLLAVMCIEEKVACVAAVGPGISIINLLFELIACSSLIVQFVFRIRFVNCLIQNHLTQERLLKAPTHIGSKRCIRFYAQESQNYYETSETNVYLREIFSCFAMYQNLYRFQLFIFCLQAVGTCLLSFELILYTIQRNQSSLTDISSFIVFCLVSVFFAIFLGFRYELFFFEVQETKRLCIDVMAIYDEGPLREKARQMLKMIDETPPRFSVYEMWDMNAGTFVTMFGVITSLIVTILQFAFL